MKFETEYDREFLKIAEKAWKDNRRRRWVNRSASLVVVAILGLVLNSSGVLKGSEDTLPTHNPIKVMDDLRLLSYGKTANYEVLQSSTDVPAPTAAPTVPPKTYK